MAKLMMFVEFETSASVPRDDHPDSESSSCFTTSKPPVTLEAIWLILVKSVNPHWPVKTKYIAEQILQNKNYQKQCTALHFFHNNIWMQHRGQNWQ